VWSWRHLSCYAIIAPFKNTELSLNGITTTHPLRELTTLTRLDLSHNRNIITVRDIALLINLRQLSLYGCEEIADLQQLSELTKIRELNLGMIFNNDDINYPSLDFIASLTKLKILILCSNDYIFDIIPLGLPKLTHLDISSVISVCDLTPLANIQILESLEMTNMVSADEGFSFLQELPKLQHLKVDKNTKLPPLSSTVNIHYDELP
jgi:Leucine-rich repeat (LRR) protein